MEYNGKFFSLRYKVLIICIVISILPIFLIAALSYIKGSKAMIRKIAESRYNLITQQSGRIGNLVNDVNELSLYIIQNDKVRDLLQMDSTSKTGQESILAADLYTDLSFFIDPHNGMYSISIEGYYDKKFVVDPLLLEQGIPAEKKRAAGILDGRGFWYFGSLESKVPQSALFYVRLIKNPDRLSENLGYLKIGVLTENIDRGYFSESNTESGNFYLLDDENRIVSTTDIQVKGSVPDHNLATLREQTDGWRRMSIDGTDSLVIISSVESVDWVLLYTVPIERIVRDVELIRNYTLVLLFIMIPVCVFLSFYFSIRFLSPLKEFVRFIGEIENENFDERLEVRKNDELGLLAAAFNTMAVRLKKLLHQVYLDKIKQKETELSALQAQINPHFLYNTLDTIYWTCRTEEAYESGDLIQALSKMFRMSLTSGNDDFTTLQDELAHLESYMAIQNKRYGERLTYILEVENGLMSLRVIKLLIQPLVENSLIHGIDRRVGHGHISVRIFTEKQDLIYFVEDDGAGCSEEILNRYLAGSEISSKSLGIKNVNDRITLVAGEEYGLTFSSVPGSGTSVVVRQPIWTGNKVGESENTAGG